MAQDKVWPRAGEVRNRRNLQDLNLVLPLPLPKARLCHLLLELQVLCH